MKTNSTQPESGENPPGAIVLGGNFVGLGIARSLGKRGVPTWVVDTDKSKCIAQFSKYTKRFIVSEEPVEELLLREAREHNLDGWVVFPVSDQYVESVAASHDSLKAIYRLITPPLEVTKYALDKRLTYSKATELGIAAPWTLVPKSLADLDATDFSFPVVLKPAINHHFFPQTNLKALAAANREELKRGYSQMRRYIPTEEILVQERIPGGGENQFSYCGLCKDGRVYASLVAKRRRQYPVEFGNASTFVETTSQPIVEAAGRQFLESIGFDGMAEVEFKFDTRDGKYKILDVNPRPWGWHSLGKAAGIDFPYQLWRQKVGLETSHVNPPRKAAWIREITDMVAILRSRSRAADILGLLKIALTGKLTSATFDFSDPVPFFAEFALWVSSGISRQKKAKEFLELNPANSIPDFKLREVSRAQ
jgi:D-aspartate ligase